MVSSPMALHSSPSPLHPSRPGPKTRRKPPSSTTSPRPRPRPQPSDEWQLFPSKQLVEIQSRVNELEQLVGDYEALHSELEALPYAGPRLAAPPSTDGVARRPSPKKSPREAQRGRRFSSTALTRFDPETPLPQEAALARIARKLDSALLAYLNRQGQSPQGNWWSPFFQGKRLTFDDFNSAVQRLLVLDISRYELRAFWGRIDCEQIGHVPADSFSAFMYRARLSSWPDFSDEHCTFLVSQMNDRADKWHRACGNWHKILKEFDGLGFELDFAQLVKVVRSRFPGLNLDTSEKDLRCLWKRLDADASGLVSVNDLIIFMRRHGSSKHARTSLKEARDAAIQVWRSRKADVVQPALSTKDLCRVQSALNKGLAAASKKRGAADWRRFLLGFADEAGKVTFPDFETAVRKLGVQELDLEAFFDHVDHVFSGEMVIDDFIKAIYVLELEPWPDVLASEQGRSELAQVLGCLSRAADKWHREADAWYKIFRMFDGNDTGRLCFANFERVVRSPFPGLGVAKGSETGNVSEKQLRGLWKALDAEKSGDVSIHEFMVFTRRHGGHFEPARADPTTEKGLAAADAANDFERVDLDDARLQVVIKTLEKGIAAEARRRGVPSSLNGNWATLFKKGESLSVDFGEVVAAVRSVGLDEKDLSRCRDLAGLWTIVDGNDAGTVTVRDFQRAMYGLTLDFWPSFTDTGRSLKASLQKAISTLNAAGERWHRHAGNWYKVFKQFDADDGAISFERFEFVLRGTTFPSLQVDKAHVSDDDLRGLWKALDPERRGETSLTDFVTFMRRHANAPTDVAPTLEPCGRTLLAVSRLREVYKQVDRALSADLRKRGIHYSVAGNFAKMFDEMVATNETKRISYPDFAYAVCERLHVKLSAEDLHGLWTYVDVHGSGHATRNQLQSAVYTLELSEWPRYLEPAKLPRLRSLLALLNGAAAKYYSARNNWFKIFKRFDANESGSFNFEDLHFRVRSLFPGLHLGAKDVSNEDLRGLWKALDVDLSGTVTVHEFMLFFRRHASIAPAETRRKQYDDGDEDAFAGLDAGKLRLFPEALKRAELTEPTDFGHDLGISEWDFPGLLRTTLRISQSALSDDDVHAVWRLVDWQRTGVVQPADFYTWASAPPKSALQHTI
mmetsp:Transcript_25917/g.92455  ORF Transcript_25917/g.92455 Transcript_25917/m.92455 type:complete len:1134 (+) Transcript_25917:110-3511(+)